VRLHRLQLQNFRQHADTVGRGTRQEAQTGGPESHLARRLLARRVQDRTPGRRPRQAGRGLQEERRFADPRLATDEDERTRDEPATEDAVELVDADPQTSQVRISDGCEAGRGATRPGRVTGPDRARPALRLVNDRLDQAVPLTAGGALPFPAQERFRTGLTDEAALRPRHR